MTSNLSHVCPLHLQRTLISHLPKCSPSDDDLGFLANGGVSRHVDVLEDGTSRRYVYDPVPGIKFDFRFANARLKVERLGPDWLKKMHQLIGKAVALEVMSRTGAIACTDKNCNHSGVSCLQPNHMKSALAKSYDGECADSLRFEEERQDALFKSGLSVHVHREKAKRSRPDSEQ